MIEVAEWIGVPSPAACPSARSSRTASRSADGCGEIGKCVVRSSWYAMEGEGESEVLVLC